ncbi:MAG: hypothetical protein ACI9KE_003756 [Polyangiales bacterium]|jgi:hypothetical protein
MPKLNQILAIESGTRKRSATEVTQLHRTSGTPALFEGLSRSYRPIADDGVQLPQETKKVQVTAEELLKKTSVLKTEIWDLTATKDATNQVAKADVVLPNGTTLLEAVPVSSLLMLEKEMNDMETFIGKLPTLDPSEEWEFDAAQNQWRSAAVETTKTKKIPRNHVRAEATDKHPAQVDLFHEDVVEGFWKRVRYSGAMSVDRKEALLDRVRDIKKAVKFAREQANGVEVTPRALGDKVFGYILAK